FANDIFKKVLVKKGIVNVSDEKADRISLRISRVAVLGVGVAAALLVINPPSFLGDLMWIGISGVSAGTLGPIMYAGFGRKKASACGAVGSAVMGLFTCLVMVCTGMEAIPLAAGGWSTLVGIISMGILAYTIKGPANAYKARSICRYIQNIQKVF